MNYIAEFLDEDLEVAASIVNRNRTIVYAVEDLTPSLQPALPQRRNPVRNENYVEDTIPLYSPDEFRNHFRMSRDTFEILINEVGSRLQPSRELLVNVQKKVLFVIWMLAKPETFLACTDRFGLAPSTGHYIYREIIIIICGMVDDFIVWPTSRQCDENAESSKVQERSRGIGNVVGAIDGTHIFIKEPVGNAVDYYNRYQSHSVILQAVCDPRMRFINISVGHPGRMHDARVFCGSSLYQRIVDEDVPLINPEYHLIGDSAYPLLQEVLTPYRDTGHLTEAETRFNVRFSSIRSTIERAFGLLKGKWRRLKFLDMSDLELLNKVIVAGCVLHNLIINSEGDQLEIVDEGDIPIVAPNITERRQHQLGQAKRISMANNLE
nr:unnamed protein product [Callosobruchus analis]